MSEDSKWTYLSKIKIHEKDKDYPLSGFERRDLIQSLLRSHECDRWTSTSKMKDHGDRYPYVTSEGLERMAYAHLPTPPPTPVPATTPTPTPTLAAVAPQSAAASNCKITAENIAGWNAIDASFVCTARYLFRLDEHPQFTKCVIDRLTAGARDGEAIVDTCLSEFRSAGGTLPTDLSCEDQLDRIHSAWPLSDREYICTDRFNIDSKIKSSYTRCVVLVSYSSSDGEVIINQCQAFAH